MSVLLFVTDYRGLYHLVPRLLQACNLLPCFFDIVCLTTYFHYLLPTVSAVYRGNCTSSSSFSCPLPRVYIETLKLHSQSSRLCNSSYYKAYIIYGGLIYKVLSITCSRLLRGTYINYNAVEFFRGIVFSGNICKWVLFGVRNVYNRSNGYAYRLVFRCN
jgi:hypothetical protein